MVTKVYSMGRELGKCLSNGILFQVRGINQHAYNTLAIVNTL